MIVFAILLLPAAGWADARADMATGRHAGERGDLATARHYLNRAIESGELTGEVLAEALFYRGIARRLSGFADDAITDYTEAMRLAPGVGRLFSNRGLAYAKQERYAEAIRDFDRAAALSPGDAEIYFRRGSAYFDMGLFGAAVADYDRAVGLGLKMPSVRLNRCEALARVGRGVEALGDCLAVLAADPGNVQARRLLDAISATGGGIVDCPCVLGADGPEPD